MPYVIKVRRNGELTADEDTSLEHADLRTAWASAIDRARHTLSDAVLQGVAASLDARVEIQNEHEETILVVPCGRVVETHTQG